jgi:hypothetical protein
MVLEAVKNAGRSALFYCPMFKNDREIRKICEHIDEVEKNELDILLITKKEQRKFELKRTIAREGGIILLDKDGYIGGEYWHIYKEFFDDEEILNLAETSCPTIRIKIKELIENREPFNMLVSTDEGYGDY